MALLIICGADFTVCPIACFRARLIVAAADEAGDDTALRQQLSDWLDLSSHEGLPAALLLYSRALLFPSSAAAQQAALSSAGGAGGSTASAEAQQATEGDSGGGASSGAGGDGWNGVAPAAA